MLLSFASVSTLKGMCNNYVRWLENEISIASGGTLGGREEKVRRLIRN